MSLDEEGGATQSNKSSFQSYLNYRSSYENLSLVDKILRGEILIIKNGQKYKNLVIK